MRELAASAGVHRSSFYLFYEDIYDLLDHAEEEIFSEIESRLEGHGEAPLSEWMLPAMAGFYEASAARLTALLGPMGDPSFSRKLKRHMVPVLCSKLGVSPEDPDVALAMELALTLILSFLAERYEEEGAMPSLEKMQKASEVLWHGITPTLDWRSV